MTHKKLAPLLTVEVTVDDGRACVDMRFAEGSSQVERSRATHALHLSLAKNVYRDLPSFIDATCLLAVEAAQDPTVKVTACGHPECGAIARARILADGLHVLGGLEERR